jgi:hypothetical protein
MTNAQSSKRELVAFFGFVIRTFEHLGLTRISSLVLRIYTLHFDSGPIFSMTAFVEMRA